MRTLLVDGDMVSYLASFNAEAADAARYRASEYVHRLLVSLEACRAIVCYSDPSRRYWRHDLFPAYKPHHGERPQFIEAAREATGNFAVRMLPTLEADDVLGILATHPDVKGEKIIVSSDKDMQTIPGLHCDPRNGSRVVSEVLPHRADFNHMVQTLTGDDGDGYPGCPGIGPKKVGRILWDTPSMWWSHVVVAFKAKGLTEADALLQARLARICRASDYDFVAKRPIPWTPVRKGVAA